MKEMFFQKKLLGKAYFIVKMTAPAMVWPVSSDKLMESTLRFPSCLRAKVRKATGTIGHF